MADSRPKLGGRDEVVVALGCGWFGEFGGEGAVLEGWVAGGGGLGKEGGEYQSDVGGYGDCEEGGDDVVGAAGAAGACGCCCWSTLRWRRGRRGGRGAFVGEGFGAAMAVEGGWGVEGAGGVDRFAG